jgi:hypothetical protein
VHFHIENDQVDADGLMWLERKGGDVQGQADSAQSRSTSPPSKAIPTLAANTASGHRTSLMSKWRDDKMDGLGVGTVAKLKGEMVANS